MTAQLAILGISGIAHRYATTIRAMPGVTVVAAWGSSPERTAAFARTHGIPRVAPTVEAVLNDAEVDGVLILTEPARHIGLATQALAFNKPMLIEKPLGVEVAECRQFAARAQGSPVPIGVISPYRFNPILETIKQQLDTLDPASPKLAQLTLLWPRNREYYLQGSGWRGRDGAVLVNQGIHWLDAMNWFFGAPLRIEARSLSSRDFLRCADTSAALIAYPNNATLLVAAGTFVAQKRPDELRIHHATGTFDYAHLVGPPPPQNLREKIARRLLGERIWPPVLPDPMQCQLEDFIQAIQTHRPPKVTLAHGLLALEVALMASGLDGADRTG
ncbi:MAG: Gfo/Idh/MocA family oxidoreductase [Magnetococcales bacterium]|nr:Gfo/Idh/MocA family oxidoreductase [Magnetococcales bacterium]